VNRALIAGVILAAGLVSGGMLIQGAAPREAGAAAASPRLFEEVMERLRRDYIDTIPTDQMLRLSASGVVQEIDERYSMLLTPERAARVRESTRGRFAGAGLEVDLRDGFFTVVAAIAGSPADSAGIEPGDRILLIDGKSTYGQTMEEVQQALRGVAGSKVRLAIDREGETKTHELTRRMITSHPVRRVEAVGPSIRYIRLATFGDETAAELGSALRSPPSSLILDLRENPGGLLDQGIEVAEMFLDPGQTIVSTRGRTPADNRQYSDKGRQSWPAMPIVVLVDSGTAHVAEVVAGALQDNNRAVLIGTTTYGKGSEQSVLPLAGGYAIKLTTARWVTPKGRVIERDSTDGGLEPDVLVREEGGGRRKETDTLSTDPVVRRAIQLLQGAKTPAELKSRVPARARKKD
jgi:carboxyl-terminal processing protease